VSTVPWKTEIVMWISGWQQGKETSTESFRSKVSRTSLIMLICAFFLWGEITAWKQRLRKKQFASAQLPKCTGWAESKRAAVQYCLGLRGVGLQSHCKRNSRYSWHDSLAWKDPSLFSLIIGHQMAGHQLFSALWVGVCLYTCRKWMYTGMKSNLTGMKLTPHWMCWGWFQLTLLFFLILVLRYMFLLLW